ncbi:MAG: hypothetical protein HQM00_01830 [Magnetococcales bacterium]|nr:hypothetical protein [Magnetococcales bacterium]
MPGSTSVLRKALLIKREVTPGVSSTPDATNGVASILTFTPKLSPMRVDKKNVAKRTFGPDMPEFDPDGSDISLQIDTPAFKAATPGAKPTVAELLFACGLKETVTANTKVTYEPQTTDNPKTAQSSSAELFFAGHQYSLVGVRGTFTLTGAPKDGLVFKFTLSAPWSEADTNIAIPAAPPDPGNRVTFSSVTAVTSNGDEIDIGAFEFSLNAEIQVSVSSVGVNVYLLDHKPTLKIDPFATATLSDWNRLLASSSFALHASFNGGALVLDIPKAVLVESNPKDRSGRISNERVFECCEVDGDDQFLLTFA